MRVALMIGALSGGGAERQFMHLACGLANRGHEVDVVTFRGSPEDCDELESAGVRIHLLGEGHTFLRSQLALIRILRWLRPQVVYAFLEASCFRASVARIFINDATIVWGIRNSGVDPKDYSSRVRVLRVLLKAWGRTCTLAISNSSAGVQYAASIGVPAERTVVIPNGIRQPVLQTNFDRASLRNRLGITETAFVFGVLARNDPMKGVDVFVRAAGEVSKERSDVAYIIAGPGNDRIRFDHGASTAVSSQVHFVGEVNPWVDFFPAIDALVSSSRYGEGFSNSIAEALLAGKPVICTDVGDSRLVVGPFGTVVRADDPQSLARAMIHQVDRPYDQVESDRRTAWIEDNFGVAKMVELTEKALMGVTK